MADPIAEVTQVVLTQAPIPIAADQQVDRTELGLVPTDVVELSSAAEDALRGETEAETLRQAQLDDEARQVLLGDQAALAQAEVERQAQLDDEARQVLLGDQAAVAQAEAERQAQLDEEARQALLGDQALVAQAENAHRAQLDEQARQLSFNQKRADDKGNLLDTVA